jgi:EAL domain-containing protein (putative c-di-GMP-specific phosphodiesterase class I)
MEDVDKAIDGIYQAFEVPVKIDDIDYSLGLSIGISSHPNHGSKISDLIRKADIAMYQSKRLSTNRQVYYQDYMEQEILDETKIKDTLKRALKNDGFKIVVQPQYCLETKAIISYEALARLKESPTPPNRFIFVAEKYNLINELGRVIIVKAIQTLAHMAENGIELRPIYVNLSAKQLSDTTLVPFILQQLENHHISPQFFGIELTESTLIDNEVFAQNFLDNIRELGIKIALDDFGSGQAGLNYLTKYPLQMVKLDRAFSLNYLSEEKLETYRMLVNFAVLLGFKVLAEGIEEEGQISLLKQTAVTMVQGYVYSRPLEVEDLIVKIKQNLLP